MAVGAVSGIADSPLVLGLTKSRLWIGVLGSLLVGIVALNVMALSFNAGSSKTAGLSDQLREENSALRADIADGLSNERLQTAADRIGLVMPEAAATLMLTPGAGDAEAAAARLRQGEITVGSTYVVPSPVAPFEAETTPVIDRATGLSATDPGTAAPVDTAAAPVTETAITDPTTLATTDTADAGGISP